MTAPNGTGYKLTALINSWSTLQLSGSRTAVVGSHTKDYAPVNLGQLKNVAQLFYNRLIEVGYVNQYPWSGSSGASKDYAMANIGQIKNLFNFDVTYDSDGNGLPDWWELKYFGAIGQSPSAQSPIADGYTILQDYQASRNPVSSGLTQNLTANIGAAISGSSSYNATSGTFSIVAAGADIDGTSDQFRFVYQELPGDFVLIARVTGLQNVSAWSKAGLMIRNTLAANSANVMVALTPGNGVTFQGRSTAGGGSGTYLNTPAAAPVWLKLQRLGGLFVASKSSDGVTWQLLGTTTIAMNSTVYAGLAVTSHNAATTTTATFANVNLTATGSDGLQAPWSRQDIGSPGLQGYAQYASSLFTLGGGGSDIYNAADQFGFTYQPLTGDGYLTARILSQQDTNGSAKAGIMIRESLSVGSRNSLIALTPGVSGLDIQERIATGSSTLANSAGAASAPVWVRAQRHGNSILGWRSADGVNWTLASSNTLSALASQVYIGMAVSSHNNAELSTATFDNVAMTLQPPSPALPVPWNSADIGSPVNTGYAQGSLQSDGQSLSVQVAGGGTRITGSSDQFQYVFQGLSGDGKIVAEVLSQSDTSPLAQAGLMIREDAAASSRQVMVATTPGSGFAFAYRTSTNGTTTTKTGGTASMPKWLRLERNGSLFTAWTSPDGATWTLSGTVSLAMSSNAQVGLAVSGNNASMASVARFSNVLVTTPASTNWDSDNNGLADAWEIQYFGHTGVNPAAPSPRGMGIPFYRSTQMGRDPDNYLLSIVSGTNQTGTPGHFTAAPLVVKVTNSGSTPVNQAPVTFSVAQGGGLLSTTNSGSATFSSLQLLTGTNGQAQLYYELPPGANTTSIVTAQAGNALQSMTEYGVSPYPQITSPATVITTIHAPFSYAITATKTPSSYNASGLPAGLSVTTSTGIISGSASASGIYNVNLSAINSSGTGAGVLLVDVISGTSSAPVINSGTAAVATAGSPFTYQITASNNPTGFAATGLPSGLVVDPFGGLISGSVATSGTYALNFKCGEWFGNGQRRPHIDSKRNIIIGRSGLSLHHRHSGRHGNCGECV